MGYGGNLIWTGVLEQIYIHDGKKPLVSFKPNLSDLLCGYLYDRYSSLESDPVFSGNEHVIFNKANVSDKPRFISVIDKLFLNALKLLHITDLFERLIFILSSLRFQHGDYPRLVHVDMRIHSYAKKQNRKKTIWKKGGHAIEIIAKNFSVTPSSRDCHLFLTKKEHDRIAMLVNKFNLEKFIVIEAGTNTDWFGNLRSWEHSNWQNLVNLISYWDRDYKIVQIGLKDSKLLDSVIDFRGTTTFREAALLIQKSNLFIGTEGGLMHAAKAVKANAVIIWGGVTLPEFAGYAEAHEIVCHYVSCSPCGNHGWCDNDHICMSSINVNEVFLRVKNFLK